jgi:endo-1,4-beta-xylanase
MSRVHLAALAAALSLASARHLTDSELQAFYGTPDHSRLPPLRYRTRGVDASQTLRQAAAARNVYVGFAAAYAHLTNASDPKFASVGFQQFSLTTAENDCKWGETEPAQGSYTLQDCGYVAQATLNASGVARGHNLAWGVDNPGWLSGGFTPSQLMSIWTDHANHVLGTFGPEWLAVDVINEPVCDDPNCPKNGTVFKNYPPWWPAIPDFFDQALQVAKGINGKAILMINDYGAGEADGLARACLMVPSTLPQACS